MDPLDRVPALGEIVASQATTSTCNVVRKTPLPFGTKGRIGTLPPCHLQERWRTQATSDAHHHTVQFHITPIPSCRGKLSDELPNFPSAMTASPDNECYFVRDEEIPVLVAALDGVLSRSAVPLLPRVLAWRLSSQTGIPSSRVMGFLRKRFNEGKLELVDGRVPGRCTGRIVPPPGLEGLLPPRPDWRLFRQLIPYYVRCLQAENGYSPVTWQNRLGDDFVFLDLPFRRSWYPLGDSAWELFIPMSDTRNTPGSLVREGGSDLVLGYPVSVSTGTSAGQPSVKIVPVFCYSLTCTVSHLGLHVRTVQAKPFVNRRWLNYGIGYATVRRRFLDLCGLRTSALDEDSAAEDGSPDVEFRGMDLKALADILGVFVPGQVRETLDPCHLNASPFEEDAQNGIYNRAVLLRATPLPYVRRLISELREIGKASDSTLEGTALRHFFAPSTDEGEKLPEGAVAEAQSLNAEQRRAIASLLYAPLTVIQGPPGTGKSQVAATTVANARLTGQSVLVSSYNHKALDAVMSKLDLEDGVSLAVRANSKEEGAREIKFHQALKKVLTCACSPEAGKKYEEECSRLVELLRKRCKLCASAAVMESLAEEMGRLEGTMESIYGALPEELQRGYLESDVTLGLSAKTLYRALTFLRLFDDSPKRLLLLLVERPLAGVAFLRFLVAVKRCTGRRMGVDGLAGLYTKADLAELTTLCRRFVEFSDNRTALENLKAGLDSLRAEHGDWETELAGLSRDIVHVLPSLLRLDVLRRQGVEKGDRAEVDYLQKWLSKSQNTLENGERCAENLPRALHYTPVWAATSLSVGKFLPLVPGMFDLAIVDEAGQSSFASAIPILFRAKRAGVIGDPKQLRFIATLSEGENFEYMEEMEISSATNLIFSYPDNSLYDVAIGNPVANSFLLKETYRSAAEIVAYCNMFYGGNLSVATDESRLLVPEGHVKGIEWSNIKGNVRPEREGSTYCEEEVEAVCDLVVDLIRNRKFEGTIGVVTPFKAQRRRIEETLFGNRGVTAEETELHRLHVNTAHGFQGDERDVIIMSLCGGPGLGAGSYAFLEKNGNLFNVAASRARALLLVVGNREWAETCEIAHIEALADPSRRKKGAGARRTLWYPHESPYEKYFFDMLVEAGLKPVPQFPVLNRRLDLALVDGERKLDIEIDGTCHLTSAGTRKMDDHWRDQQLRSLGWVVVRFWTRDIDRDVKECVQKICIVWSDMNKINNTDDEEGYAELR